MEIKVGINFAKNERKIGVFQQQEFWYFLQAKD